MPPSLRRSTRGKSDPSERLQGAEGASPSKVVHTRSVKVAADLTSDQWDTLRDEGTDIKTLQTHFLTTLEAYKNPVKTFGKSKRTGQSNVEAFAVGDTVLIDPTMPSGEPSIAVITGIWKVTIGDEDFCLNVSVHWFLRPTQLPAVRAERAQEKAEIYYLLTGASILPSTRVIGRCIVTSSRTLGYSEHEQTYCCFYATNTQKGLFYDFDWERHKSEALKFTRHWESLQQWDVTAINPPETPKKQQSAIKRSTAPRQAFLPDVPEVEENSEASDDDVTEPGSPSKRKRKRAVRASVSPTKRVKTTTSDLPEVSGSFRPPAVELEDDTLPTPYTPSRRGRKTAATHYSDFRKHSKPADNASKEFAPSTPSRRARARAVATSRSTRKSSLRKPVLSDEDDSGSEFEAPSEPSESEPEVDQHSEAEVDNVQDEPDAEDFTPRTPSRRKRGSVAGTPRRPRTTLAAPTPHSKAALRARAKKRSLAVRPPPPGGMQDLSLQLENVSKDPWLRAMHVLHVSARPEAHRLPCRETEYSKVLQAVEELLEEGSGGCIYISGVPGTGKTATVHAVVRELKRMAEQNEANPFTYVEINGLRIPEPSAAYNLLWEAVSGHKVSREGHLNISSKESLKLLTRHFGQGERIGPGGHACIVLMDELDQLMTTKQDVVYNFFNWPTLLGSKLIVLAVANTMDLPERVMSGRVRSRLGMVRINFQPYTTPQLEQIVKARLLHAKEGLPSNTADVIAPDGIKFAAMKVSSISGDARRVLDICRRAVELVQSHSRTARTDDVKRVIVDMQNSPTAAYLRDLSFHERLMLAALLRCVKREGVEEIKWGDVQHQHLLHLNVLSEEADTMRRPSPGELSMVLDSLAASRAILCEEGVVVSRKPEDEKRVVLNIEHAEVERVLGEVGGTKWKNALNI